MPLSQLTRLRAQRFVRALFSRALPFWVSGSVAWFCVLALDIAAPHVDAVRYVPRAQYMIELACRYSTLLLGPLIVVHCVRWLWLRRSPRADTWLSCVLATGLAPFSFRQANLLSSGSLLFEQGARLGSLSLIWFLLLAANLCLWHLHLALVRAPRHALANAIDHMPALARGALAVLTAGLGGAALYAFSELVSHELRAYLFLSEFLLPSAFLFAASLLYGLQLRVAPWLNIVLALGICVGLSTAQGNRSAVHSAKSFFERRAGLIALTDLATGRTQGAPYANIDVAHAERFACKPPEQHAPAQAAPNGTPHDHRNVIFISVDTLRKDALWDSDEAGPVAPALRAIAEKSLSFDRAITTYPATLFAVSSALTGQSPSEIMFAPTPPKNLFTLTRAHFNEVEIALPSASWFRRPPVPQLFTQGVRPHFFEDAARSTSYVIRRLRELRHKRRSSFVWIHYYEPHTTRVTRGRDAERQAREAYAQLVRGVDKQIGRLWRELERLGYLRDSLIILFSDHGEALGEFGYFGHHLYLNQFATDIPLIVHAPDTKPVRSNKLALLSDIAPTVLDWLGMPSETPEAQSLLSLEGQNADRFGVAEAFPVRGRTLYDFARSPIRTTRELEQRLDRLRTAAIDYQPKVSLVSARYRLIVNRVTGAEEFYDRKRDPWEHNDLAPKKLKVYQRMRAALKRTMQERSERIYCRVQNASQAHDAQMPGRPGSGPEVGGSAAPARAPSSK